ncbi:hypothetical protein HKX48_007660 [Thoreauomyces humboldtii]|nr:hypothetical protein HKX48_007660 [Thoreauomyces humboldtii]
METLPQPCGLNAVRSLDGHVADHYTFRTTMCVSNRVVLALSIPDAVLSFGMTVAMFVLLRRDYKLAGSGWNMSKIFFISSAITSFGLMLGALGFMASGTGMLVLNSCTFMVGSQALIGSAYATLFQWITVTTKMLDLQEEEWLTLRIQRLRKTLLWPTYLVFAACLPICIVRASTSNMTLYNIVSLLYFGAMMPWFVNWCGCSSQFARHFARLIEATVDGTKDFTFSIQKTATGNRATITELPKDLNHTQTKSMGLGMGMGMGTDDPAKERAIEMLAIAKRVRLVGALIAADKILFILLYVVILIHGMIAWLKPEMMNAPFGFYAVFVFGIPG